MPISQAEKRQRGNDFQDEVRRSWSLIPATWRMRITDTGAGSRPADELVLTTPRNFLIEMKRTLKPIFGFGNLRENQATGLNAFDMALPGNCSLIFWSIQNEDQDEAYAFRFADFCSLCLRTGKLSATLYELQTYLQYAALPRITVNGKPGYDLRGVLKL